MAGASEGLGAAWAEGLAARGHALVLVARRPEVLEALAARLGARGTEVVALALDLGAPDAPDRIAQALEGRPLDVLVYNAAAAPAGPFLSMTPEQTRAAIDVNCRAPVGLLHRLLPGMVQRQRGAVVLMSSLTAFQGTAYTAVYGATKAFNLSLAEALWAELEGTGVSVLACCAGATRTPGYVKAMPDGAPGELAPEQVVAEALTALKRGPLMVPGLLNRVVAFLFQRVLPRRVTIKLMASRTRSLKP